MLESPRSLMAQVRQAIAVQVLVDVVWCAEVLNKYVGESEANIRNLFAEAEAEQKKMGFSSALHIIIFDEIDAICRTRGSLSGSTGVHDTVVNQLLAKVWDPLHHTHTPLTSHPSLYITHPCRLME